MGSRRDSNEGDRKSENDIGIVKYFFLLTLY